MDFGNSGKSCGFILPLRKNMIPHSFAFIFFIFSTFINCHCEKLSLSLDVGNVHFILCINMYTMKKPLFCQKNAFTCESQLMGLCSITILHNASAHFIIT